MSAIRLFLFLACVTIATVAKAQPKIGQQVPEITLKDVNDKTVPLSSLKGKVVLLDFWASWCGPCRKANKGFVSLYAKMKSKGFEIYSVSIDDQKAAWERAIADDQITWLQVNDKGGWYAPIATAWNLQQIPSTWLLDKQGKIVGHDLEGRQLEFKIDKLLKQ